MASGTPDLAIRAAGLGKRFTIGVGGERRTLPGMLRHWITGGDRRRVLWALRGIGFELRRGDILGVVGPNGSGKSTLLLLLAQILAPTEGTLEVFGKTDPFFQLSAGLQLRLTVLENFSLCSALLGMRREQFRRRRTEMIAFSGLEDYLYARYGELSSGLAARLPFAVAIHADLDIILVDEMLSVGDHDFQSKCLKAFRELTSRGKTLVVVSHDQGLVESLCSTTLFLKAGRQAFLGETAEAMRRMNHGEAETS